MPPGRRAGDVPMPQLTGQRESEAVEEKLADLKRELGEG